MLFVAPSRVGERFATLSMPENGSKDIILQAQFHRLIDQYQRDYLATDLDCLFDASFALLEFTLFMMVVE